MNTYRYRYLTTSLCLMLIWGVTGTALAVTAEHTISRLPDRGIVEVSGTVDSVNDHTFMLRDKTGSIDVQMPANESTVLKTGDEITVVGTVENRFFGLLGKDIQASRVDVHKSLSSTLSDALTESTGISLQKAQAVSIGNVPDHGKVQLHGTVASVESGKNFTLRDPSGTIDVSVQSNENVVLNKGAKVTAIGYIENGILGKKLRATHIIVTADASGS